MISGTTVRVSFPIICRSSEIRELVASYMRRTVASAWVVTAAYNITRAAVIVAIMRAMLLRESI